MPPLGIAELAGMLRRRSIGVETVDLEILAYNRIIDGAVRPLPIDLLSQPCEASSLPKKNGLPCLNDVVLDVVRLLPLNDVRMISFSVMGQRQFYSAVRLGCQLRAMGYVTSLGGCYASNNIDLVRESQAFDYLFLSPATKVFVEMCDRLLTGKVASLPKQLEILTDRKQQDRTVSIPYYDDAQLCHYTKAAKHMYRSRAEHLILHHRIDDGCTGKCSFCIRHKETYWARPVDEVVLSVSQSARSAKANMCNMLTNAVNLDTTYSLALYERLAEADPDLRWYAYATPSRISEVLIDRMVRSGCKILRFGLESASPSLLRRMKKPFTVKEAERTIRMAHTAGVWTQVNIIAGFPHETDEDVILTRRFVERNHDSIDSIRINPFYIQQGCQIFERPHKYHITLGRGEGKTIPFDELSGLPFGERKRMTLKSINEIFQTARAFDISQAGVCINLLLTAIVESGSRKAAKKWLRKEHPYLFENLSFESIRWRIYHSHEPEKSPFVANWSDIYGLTFEDKLESGWK